MGGIKYLTHADFIEVLRWTLYECVQGTYAEQISAFDTDIKMCKSFYGYVPFELLERKKQFKRKYARIAFYSKCICVDLSTGEVYEPCT